MGCITSYMAMAATTPNMYSNNRSSSNRTNLRRQTADTRTSTTSTTTGTTSSRSSTISKNTITKNSAPASKLTQQKTEIFTISNGQLEFETKNNKPNESEIDSANKHLQTKQFNLQRPTISSIARQTTLPSNKFHPISSNNKSDNSITQPEINLSQKKKSYTANFANKPKNSRRTNQWKSAQARTFPLASVTPTTPSTPPSTSSSSLDSTSNQTPVKSKIIKEEEEAISIDQLLGIRLDSAKLQKILERKKSQAENILKSGSDSSKSIITNTKLSRSNEKQPKNVVTNRSVSKQIIYIVKYTTTILQNQNQPLLQLNKNQFLNNL